MALGTISSSNTNSHNHHHPYQRPTISAYQHQYKPRAIAPTPSHTQPVFARKSSSEKLYGGAIGTTLDSNNPAVVRRNARERNRVKQVNNGFTHLRQHIPPAIIADLSNGRRGIGPGAHKKLSKVDTLRMAVEYIRRLQHVIDEVDGKRGSNATASLTSASTWSNITTDSPPPTPPKGGEKIYPNAHDQSALFADKMQKHFQALNYGESLQQQQQQPQLMHFKYEQSPHLQQQQEQQHQHLQHQQYFNQLHPALISPAGSVSSSHSSPSYSSSDCNESEALSLYSRQSPNALSGRQQFELPLQMKYEQQFNEEVAECGSGDEEDLLEYISLWQDDV